MSKKKKQHSKRKKPRFTPINKHQRKGSKLTTALSSYPNLQMIDWERDLMPEHLWIELLANECKSLPWHKIYEDFMDRLDSALEYKRKTPLLGLMSDFSLLTEKEKGNFLSKNKEFIHKFFFIPIGKILSFYPENPANWLVLDEWKNHEKIDFEIELKRLADSLSRLIKAKDNYAGHIRTIPITRFFKHGKISLPSSGMEDLIDSLTRYPGKCSKEEKYKVQSFSRMHINTTLITQEPYKSTKWPRYFWQQNYNLVPCAPVPESLEKGDIEVHNEKIKAIQEKLWKNCVVLMKYLDKAALQYKYDLYNPMVDEIKLGLFSRIIRMYISFVSNPFLWTRDLSGIMLRCIGETAIVFFYLVKKGTKEDFQRFHDYALGKEKLLMLHIQDTFPDFVPLDGKTTDEMAKDIGGGFKAEITDIDLKGWIKKDIREMAYDVELEDIYKLIVDPSNSEIHGSWSSIRKSNLVICRQILHRFHKVPKFYEPPVYLASLFVAETIYLRAQKLAIDELGTPQPDEVLAEISEITKGIKK